jgi:hypothetical protein
MSADGPDGEVEFEGPAVFGVVEPDDDVSEESRDGDSTGDGVGVGVADDDGVGVADDTGVGVADDGGVGVARVVGVSEVPGPVVDAG